MTISILLFALGLVLLIKGGDWFVDGAVGIANRLHLPEVVIGATIVSIGTTLPEVMVSAQAAMEHNSGISYGNAIGSIICNTSLIAAVSIVLKPMAVKKRPLFVPVFAFFISAVVYTCIAAFNGGFDRIHGILLLCMFAAYILLVIIQMKRAGDLETSGDAAKKQSDIPTNPVQMISLLVMGAVAIAVGARLLVDHGTIIAAALGVPDSVIGLTMVALGTSLPELVTAITSYLKGYSSLSLGNIIGANLFNIVLVSGTAITISPFALPAGKTIMDHNASLCIDIPVMFTVMLILSLPTLIKGKIYRIQGIVLLCIYAAFTIFQFAF